MIDRDNEGSEGTQRTDVTNKNELKDEHSEGIDAAVYEQMW